jgi:excisionase family DNA binding protein
MDEDFDPDLVGLPDVLTVEEAAAALEISVATVRRRCAAGQLPSEKVGKQWVVHRRAIEMRRPRRRPARGTPGSMLDFAQALRHVRDVDLTDRDIGVPDLLRYRDQLSRPEQVLQEGRQIISGALAPSTGIELELPKSAFFSRTALILPLPERVAYQAAVASIAFRADAALPKSVYGGRVDLRPRFFLKPGVDQWLVWKRAVKRAIRGGQAWMVKTDVTAYFDNLKHSTLFSAIEAHNPDPLVLDALKRLLRAWALVPGQGIPQGPNASRFLQNLYFRPIDDEMGNGPWAYFRYLDDIRITGRSRREALGGLQVLERACKRRGLVLSAQKTKLLEGAKALKDWDDDAIDRTQYLLDVGNHDEARKGLRRLLKSAIAADGVLERRRFRFSLWRILKLRDREPLRTVLQRLEDLAPAAQLVAVYLRPWIASEVVERELATFLGDPNRNTSPYLEAWLMAVMLEKPGALPTSWVTHARRVARDRNRQAYVRGFATNILARGKQAVDVDWVRSEIKTEHDPALIRAYVVALWRIGELDGASAARASSRSSSLADSVSYLKRAGRIPSLLSGDDAVVPQ